MVMANLTIYSVQLTHAGNITVTLADHQTTAHESTYYARKMTETLTFSLHVIKDWQSTTTTPEHTRVTMPPTLELKQDGKPCPETKAGLGNGLVINCEHQIMYNNAQYQMIPVVLNLTNFILPQQLCHAKCYALLNANDSKRGAKFQTVNGWDGIGGTLVA
ncbi:profilin-2 [Platysternon megacephalum]|uniref:Profilin-2 n=1 Tax=Platysternon megacephalum TaxID=55544 RepID=A0A4D9EIY8_9SAUR|nr:profilin-2 [Platysternon megacephalum]